MDDLIQRKTILEAFGLSEKTRKYGGDHSGYNTIMLYEVQDIIEQLPSVNVCTDAISRADIIERCERVIKHGVSCTSGEHLISVERVLDKVKTLPSVSTEKTGQMSGAQHLEDIANGKFNEPYTCVSIKIGNETRHICVVNCSRVCHNPRCACEKNKDACPSCGAKMEAEE